MTNHENSFKKVALLGTAFLIVCLSGIFYYINSELRSAIEKAGEASNATLTRVFVNETWSEIAPLLPPPGSTEQDAAKNPNIKKIDNRIRRFMSYTDVLKVKLYNVKGLTTYSSETKQIGEDKSKNTGFQQALKGKLASELTYRGKFGAFDGEMYNRNLVSTYAPIRDGYQVVAVAEIYSDRTASIEQAVALRNELLIVLVSSFGAIYLLMLYFSYRAFKRIIAGVTASAASSSGHLGENVLRDSELPANGFPVAGAPLPELTLTGVEKIIHQLSLAIDSNGRLDTRIDPRLLLSDVTKTAKDIAERISRYRLLGSVDQQKGLASTKIDFERLIQDLSDYAHTRGYLKTIKFHQGQKFQDGFIQDPKLIEVFLASLIDFIGFGFSDAEVEVKFFGDDDTLSVDLIMQNFSGKAKPRTGELFYALDGQLNAAAKLAAFGYKATLTEKGLLASLTIKKSASAAPQETSPKHNNAVVLSSSELDAKLFVSALDRCGVKTNVVTSSQEMGSLAPCHAETLFFILQDTLSSGLANLDSIVRIAKDCGLQAKNTYLVTDGVQSVDLSGVGFQVLRMPIDSQNLAQLVSGGGLRL